MEQLAQWDSELFIWLNGLGVEQLDAFWLLVTHIGNWTPLYILFFILFLKAFSRKHALIATLFSILTLITALGLTALIKNTVRRLRPSSLQELEGVIRVLETPSDYSFWSGHAAVSFAITVFVVYVLCSWSKWVYLIFIWPLLFTLSRIFVGVHYPIDLIVGTIAGSLIGFSFYKLYIKII